jgi:hypothetical protein
MSNTGLIRVLVGFAGLCVGAFGFMLTSSEWMQGRPQFWGHWVVLIVGALMWLQALPVMRASEREERRNQIRKMLKGEKD